MAGSRQDGGQLTTCLPAGKAKKKAFTLIEILIVCAIIAMLAAVAIVTYDKAKMKSRDAIRVQDLETIASAFHLYYQDNATYKISGTGQSPGGVATGHGWFHLKGGTYAATSISEGLKNAGYVRSIINDPSGDPSSGNGSHNYMFYYDDISKKASTYAWLENPTAEQTSTTTNAIDQTVVFGAAANVGGYKMNYAKTISN